MDSPLIALLATLVLPGIIVWIFLGLGRTLCAKPGLADAIRLFGLAAAITLPPLWLIQALGFPPKEASDWLPWAALTAAALGWLRLDCPWRRSLASLLFFGLIVLSQTASALRYQWSPGQGALWIIGLTVVLSLQTEAWRRLPLSGTWSWFVAATYVSLVSGTLLVSGSASLAQRAGITAAALGSLFVWSILPWTKNDALGFGKAVPLLVVIAGALIVQGHLYAEVLFGPLVLLLLAPVVAWILSLVQKRAWITAGVLLGLSALALLWGVSVSPPTGY